MKQTMKKRAVIVLDIVTPKNNDLVMNIHQKIKQISEQVELEICDENIVVERVMGGLLSSERRALINSLDDIVWRGSKGKRSPIKMPTKTSQGFSITPGVKKRLQNLRSKIQEHNAMSVDSAFNLLQREADLMMEKVLNGEKTSYSSQAFQIMEIKNAM